MGIKKLSRYSWLVLGCAWLVSFSTWAQAQCVPPILDVIKKELLLTYTQTGIIYSFPFLMLALFSIPAGRLSDRVGVRRAGGIGVTIIATSGTLRGIYSNFYVLLIFSALYGVGWALIVPNLPKLVKSWFPWSLAGTITGVYSTGINLGNFTALALTRSLIFPLTNSWRAVYFIWGAIAMVATMTWWFIIEGSSKQSKDAFKIVPWEEAFHIDVWLVALTLFLLNVVFFSLLGWLPVFFVERGATPALSALMTSAVPLAGVGGVFLIPAASDRIGSRKKFFLVLPSIVATNCYILLHVSHIFALMLAVIIGFLLAGLFSLCLTMPTEIVKAMHIGTATGLIISIGYAGGLVGPLVVGCLRDITGSFTYSFLIFISALVVITILGFFLPETVPKKERGRA